MKCPNCNNNMVVNSKGAVECPVCQKLKRKIEATKVSYNDFEFYKVKKTLNIVVEQYLLPEDVEDLVNRGVEVTVK